MGAQRVIDLIRRNIGDLFLLFLVPCFVAVLPWSLGFPLLRFLARHDKSHPDPVEQAYSAAKRYCEPADAEDWKWRFRLLRLLERVDAWLILLRPASWWRRQIDQVGEWPLESGPCVFLTNHWGGGQWIWRPLSEHGFKASFIARRAEVGDLGAGRIALWFARVREFGMRRTGGLGPIFTGGSGAKVVKALQCGESVVGMLDLPAQPHQTSALRPLLGGQVHFPVGLARLAVFNAVPIVLYSCAFDVATGRRSLRVETLPIDSDVETIATRYMEHLDRCLQQDSAFWQLWSLAPLMFTDDVSAIEPGNSVSEK